MSDTNQNLRSCSLVIAGDGPLSGFSLNQFLSNYAAIDPNIPTGALEAIKDETHLTFNSPPSPFYDLTGIATSVTLDGSALLTSAGFAGGNLSPNYNGTGSVVRFTGADFQPTINSGTIGQFMAAGYFLNSLFGGTVPMLATIYVDSPIAFGGTITTNYGLYIEDHSTTGLGATNYNLWSNGTSAVNHFEGRVYTGSLGVGNSASASTLGSVVKKIEVFDASGTSLGFVPIYDSIT